MTHLVFLLTAYQASELLVELCVKNNFPFVVNMTFFYPPILVGTQPFHLALEHWSTHVIGTHCTWWTNASNMDVTATKADFMAASKITQAMLTQALLFLEWRLVLNSRVGHNLIWIFALALFMPCMFSGQNSRRKIQSAAEAVRYYFRHRSWLSKLTFCLQ